MTISMIAAAGENNVIGKDNGMPWHLPADLKFFKQTTMGHHVIMGRRSFEALGKPLPDRTNVIITRQQDYEAEGATVVHSLDAALKLAEGAGEEEAMILGGGEIYRQALSVADKIYLTRIHATFEGDTYFPEITESDWKEVSKDAYKADEKNLYDYTFLTYMRR